MKEGQGLAAPAPKGAGHVPPAPGRPKHAAPAGPAGPAAGQAEEPHARVDARKLESALLELRSQIVRIALPLECPGVEEVRTDRLHLISQIDDYLLPRLRQPGSPILIAMVGSTGAGKSTLLNSIVGAQVSATGIRRPTTNSPVLACHPRDMRWFAENVFLPTLPRVRQQGLVMPGRDGLLVLAASEGLPEGVAMLDTPDIDSVVAAHREFARQFLDASDLWLFVTTARRYADAVVWELLRDARDRGASLGIVLSRVPPSARQQLTAHFDAMLAANGLGDVERFVIPETVVTDARLPSGVSAPIRGWLADTARRDDRRVAILTKTMSGVLDTFKPRITALAAQAENQQAVRAELRSAADAAYAAGMAEFDEATRNGSLLSGEVLARWQDFAGTGELLQTLELRKARRSAQRSRRQAMSARAAALKLAVRGALEALVVSVADRAADDAIERWQANRAGACLLGEVHPVAFGLPVQPAVPPMPPWAGAERQPGLPGTAPSAGDSLRSSADLRQRAARVAAAWQDQLLRLVQAENVTKRSIARIASFDPESLALVLTVGIFGYGAADVTVSEGASASSQRLLTALFGAALLRELAGQARQDLHERIGLLFAEEALRFTALIDGVVGPDEAAPRELYQASYSLESVR